MAADFQNAYRYNVSLCSSVVLADVSEHNSNPARENELRYVGGTCFFLLLAWFRIPACFRLSYIVGKYVDADCWFSRTKCGCCSSLNKKLSPSSPKTKNNFLSRPIKRLARQEVQPPCFLLTWYEPRPWPTGIWKFRSNDTAQSISFP